MGKRLDPKTQPEKQAKKPKTVTKTKEVFEIKCRLGQGRVCLRCKTKTLIPTSINKPYCASN